MEKDRLLAMTDGVVAIIITIMVLELKAPNSADLHGLRELLPVFLAYALSFIYVAIYWNYFSVVMRATGRSRWLPENPTNPRKIGVGRYFLRNTAFVRTATVIATKILLVPPPSKNGIRVAL